MSTTKPPRIPSYRLHKPSGQAVVTLDGRTHYLGKHNSAASRLEYNRRIAEWTAAGGAVQKRDSNALTVVELIASHRRHAKTYYRRPDGRPSTEFANFQPVYRRLKELYGRTCINDFGPLALKAIRQKMIDEGLSRTTINHTVNRIRRIVKYGVENELVKPSVLEGLRAVPGLRRGRSDAKETPSVKPVPDAFVDAVLPFVSRQVAAMIELQRLTGMRSGEVCIMRTCDLDTSGRVWIYTPGAHKTDWHDHERVVYLGPRAQAVVKPFLRTDIQAFLFSPAEAEAERNEALYGKISPNRKTKVYPCELRARARRRKARKGRQLRNKYTPNNYCQAVKYALARCNKLRLAEAKEAGIDPSDVDLVPHWHPHQLRHNAATNLRREHGIEVARIILGHRSAAITEVYAEVDHARAIELMAKIG